MNITEDLQKILDNNYRGYSIGKDGRIHVEGSFEVPEDSKLNEINGIESDLVFIEGKEVSVVKNTNCNVNMLINSPEIQEIHNVNAHFIDIKKGGQISKISNTNAHSIMVESQQPYPSGNPKVAIVNNVTAGFYFYLRRNDPKYIRYMLSNCNIARLYLNDPNDVVILNNNSIKSVMYQDKDLMSFDEFIKRFNMPVYDVNKVWNRSKRRFEFSSRTECKESINLLTLIKNKIQGR